jgi:hypothetical protein
MTITQRDVYSSINEIMFLEAINDDWEAIDFMGEEIQGYPVSFELVQQFLRHHYFLLDQWNEGNNLTDYEYMFGIDTLLPNESIHYSKPILILINHLDLSCGDLFPAIMQDNKRATLLGRPTAGAGGYVVGHHFPNLFGIATFKYTGSIIERVDHTLIENVGVTPDIIVELTARDLAEGYPDYAASIHEAVGHLLN